MRTFTMYKNTAHLLREARHAAGLSMQQMASRNHRDRSVYAHIETGRRVPKSFHALIQIAHEYGVEPRRLLDAVIMDLDLEEAMG